jgi:hypothetical protein
VTEFGKGRRKAGRKYKGIHFLDSAYQELKSTDNKEIKNIFILKCYENNKIKRRCKHTISTSFSLV